MDSQPYGNDSELLSIGTEEVYFTIKGNKETVDVVSKITYYYGRR